MSITERLLAFTLLGSEWVLWLLVALSILSIAVMVERFLALPRGTRDLDEMAAALLEPLTSGDVAAARKAIGAPASPEARVGLVGLSEINRGRDAASEAMASAKSRERLSLERRLGILGTLGNNAPFIGLFGTVLGIIKAFADLSQQPGRRGDGGHERHLRGAGGNRRGPDGRDSRRSLPTTSCRAGCGVRWGASTPWPT